MSQHKEDDDLDGDVQPAAVSPLTAATEELRSLWSMALPITAMNCLVYLRAMVSVLCLGRLGSLELAGGALAIGFTNITGYSVLFGLASGLEPLCSQAFGSGNFDLLSLSLQRAVLLLFATAIPISILWANLGPILLKLGQHPGITAVAAEYAWYSLPDLATNAVLQPLRVFLRSQGVTRPMAACTAAAVVAHVPLSLFMARSLGVKGVAMAAAVTNANMAVLLLIYIKARDIRAWRGWSAAAITGVAPLLKLAVPSCFGVCLEWWWYEIMTVLAGYLPDPAAAVGAAAVMIQTTSLMYTLPMSLAACVSTRVGNELGAGKPRRARLAAIVALCCALIVGFVNVAWTLIFPVRWARLFTKDSAVVNLAAAVLPIIGICELGNCPQTTGCGILRGTARPAVGARINLLSFYFVGTPVAVWLTFWLKIGFSGLWYGLLSAQLVCVVSVLVVILMQTDWELEAMRAKKLTGGAENGAVELAVEEKKALLNDAVTDGAGNCNGSSEVVDSV